MNNNNMNNNGMNNNFNNQPMNNNQQMNNNMNNNFNNQPMNNNGMNNNFNNQPMNNNMNNNFNNQPMNQGQQNGNPFKNNVDEKKEKMCEAGFWLSIAGLVLSFVGVTFGIIIYFLIYYFAAQGLNTKKRNKAIAAIVLATISIVITLALVFASL